MGWPDWKNVSEYNYLDNHSDILWGWEFLRRNPDYQKDWEENLQLYNQGKDAISAIRKSAQKSSKRLAKVTGRHFDMLEDMYKQTDPNHAAFFLMGNGIKEKWGWPVLFNPQNPCPTFLQFFGLPKIYFGNQHFFAKKSGKYIGYPIPIESAIFTVEVDLGSSIGPQMARIGEHLIGLQKNYKLLAKKRITRRYSSWKIYLRVLDAIAAGAKRNNAAPIIFNYKASESDTPERQWSENLKQARRIMNAGYRELLESKS